MEQFAKALAALRLLGEHVLTNQIYCFDGIDEPRQARALCRRLGIPESDDEYVTYPAKATFTPVPRSHLRSLEVALSAALPADYKLLLEKLGAFHLPGEPRCSLLGPASICAYGASIFNFQENPPWTWPAIPIGSLGTHGDNIGFLRTAQGFSPNVHLLDHEHLWLADRVEWHQELSPSLSQFVLERANQVAMR